MAIRDIFSKEEWAHLSSCIIKTSKKVSASALKKKGVICYGLGVVGKKIIASLQDENIPIDWIIDKKQAGTHYASIPVLPPKSIEEASDRYLVLGGMHSLELLKICREHGVTNVLFPYHLPKEIIAESSSYSPFENLDTNNKYNQLFSILKDSTSQKALKDVLSYRLTQDTTFLSQYNDEEQYFPKDLKDSFDYSVFYDCGAYIGDTFLAWLSYSDIAHTKYIGIEASNKNFQKLKKTVADYPHIESKLYYNALADKEGKKFFNDDDTSATFDIKGNQVDAIRLDSIITPDASFIKMDLEGSEKASLYGLQNFLSSKKNGKCTLALSVYHLTEDLYEIPFTLLKFAPHAKIYFRHHSKSYLETVCYANI